MLSVSSTRLSRCSVVSALFEARQSSVFIARSGRFAFMKVRPKYSRSSSVVERSSNSRKSHVTERAFCSEILVRFADCDPAQMVFYPRYLVMFNDLVEDWFREGLKLPFSYYHFEQQHGLPTVHLEVDFVA